MRTIRPAKAASLTSVPLLAGKVKSGALAPTLTFSWDRTSLATAIPEKIKAASADASKVLIPLGLMNLRSRTANLLSLLDAVADGKMQTQEMPSDF